MLAGLFIYGYSCYYYFARSDMSGFMQTSCAPYSFPRPLLHCPPADTAPFRNTTA
jgi:hypothetical protein